MAIAHTQIYVAGYLRFLEFFSQTDRRCVDRYLKTEVVEVKRYEERT